MTPEEAAAIKGREGKESPWSVAKRYGTTPPVVRGIWAGREPPIDEPDTGVAHRRIRERMKELGATYPDIAAEIGCHHKYVGELVRGESGGSVARYAVARALDRYPEDFWWDDYEEVA